MADFSRIIIFAGFNERGFCKKIWGGFPGKEWVEVIFLNLCPLIFGREKQKRLVGID